MTDSKHSEVYVDLMGQALAPSTHSKYSKALALFEAYCDQLGLVVHSDRDVDRHLVHFIQHLYDTGKPQDLAKNAVYGVQHHCPWLAHQLGASKLALRGWKRLKPSVSHPPLTWEITCLLATWMAMRAQHDAALAMLVGFDCYLRIGELLSLRLMDVAVSDDSRLGSAYRGVLLRLAKTKTGTNQAVTVQDPVVARLLSSHVQDMLAAGHSKSTMVFQVSKFSFYNLFHGSLQAFGLSGQGYSPHSLRHGGATRAFLQGKSINDIRFRGRWSNAKSVRTYIQSGRALLLLTEVSSDVFAAGESCAELIDIMLPWLHRKKPSPSFSSAHAEALRAGRRTSKDRKVRGAQAS